MTHSPGLYAVAKLHFSSEFQKDLDTFPCLLSASSTARFALMNVAFDQEDFRVDENLEIIR